MQEENKTQEDKKIPEGNVHPDQSVLSENSAFYKPEDNRTTREKLQSMNFKDKIIFIVQYYGLYLTRCISERYGSEHYGGQCAGYYDNHCGCG